MPLINTFVLKHLLVALLLSITSLSTSGTATAAQFGDIRVQELSQPISGSLHGYADFRYTVTNASAKSSHVVELSMRNYQNQVAVRRSVTVGPGSTITVSLPVPPATRYTSSTGVEIDGSLQETTISSSWSSAGLSSLRSSANSIVLCSQGVPATFIGNKEVAIPTPPTSSYPPKPTLTLQRSSALTSQWSDQWLSYSSNDGLVMTSTEWRDLLPGVRDAVTRYVHAGGVLLLLGVTDAPTNWLPRSDPRCPFFKVADTGLGAILVADESAFSRTNVTAWEIFRNITRDTQQPFAGATGEDYTTIFPATENRGVPTRMLIGFIIVFAVLIGPVNMIYLARKNRRIWLLWTVPTASLLASAGIFVFAVLSEGVTPYVRASQFVLLDERSHQASTLGWLGIYAPLTPSGGLRFDGDTEVTKMQQYEAYDQTTTTDWTSGQHLTSGWISSRVSAHFMLRASQNRRERLMIEPGGDGESLSVVNGLGVPIESLLVADKSGTLYSCGAIAPGAKAVASRTTEVAIPDRKQSKEPIDLRPTVYLSQWPSKVNELVNMPQGWVAPGCYMAKLSDTPFVDDGLGHSSKRKTSVVVYGITAEAPAGASVSLVSWPENTEAKP